MVYLLPFFSYSAGSNSVSVRPSDQDAKTNTALEAIASSSGKQVVKCTVTCVNDIDTRPFVKTYPIFWPWSATLRLHMKVQLLRYLPCLQSIVLFQSEQHSSVVYSGLSLTTVLSKNTTLCMQQHCSTDRNYSA